MNIRSLIKLLQQTNFCSILFFILAVLTKALKVVNEFIDHVPEPLVGELHVDDVVEDDLEENHISRYRVEDGKRRGRCRCSGGNVDGRARGRGAPRLTSPISVRSSGHTLTLEVPAADLHNPDSSLICVFVLGFLEGRWNPYCSAREDRDLGR
ncbi:hypothetical protein SESBI_49420 [Sesbania bispinosa]|nr:hypothetical protein SESBI_49420 [Sesbania bispinosa]